MKNELNKLGFSFPDSTANFIFAKHNTIDGETIYNELRKRNILVRHFKDERIKDYLRITIGTKKEMQILVCNIKKILEEQNENK